MSLLVTLYNVVKDGGDGPPQRQLERVSAMFYAVNSADGVCIAFSTKADRDAASSELGFEPILSKQAYRMNPVRYREYIPLCVIFHGCAYAYSLLTADRKKEVARLVREYSQSVKSAVCIAALWRRDPFPFDNRKARVEHARAMEGTY